MIPKEPNIIRHDSKSMTVNIAGMDVPSIWAIKTMIAQIGSCTTEKGRIRETGNTATYLNRRLLDLRRAQVSVIPYGLIPVSREYELVKDEENSLTFKETIVLRSSAKNQTIEYWTFIFNVTLN